MPMKVTYREARAGDLAAISRLVLAICERELFPQFEYAGRETLREIYGLESLRTQLDAGGAFVLAEAGGQPVGAVALRPPAHIFLLYVDSSYRRLSSPRANKIVCFRHRRAVYGHSATRAQCSIAICTKL